MPAYTVLLNNFITGEISPQFYGRLDTQQYASGCRKLYNFLPLRIGGVERRPGTYYVANTDSNNKARLIPFKTLGGQEYVLEFTNQKLRVYKNGALVMNGPTPYSLSTPYVEADLFDLKYAMVEGELWIVHRGYQPRKLSRSTDTNWALATISFTGVPFASAGNYPGAIALHGGRVYLASTSNNPHTIWASKSPNPATGDTRYTDFTLGANPDDAIAVVQADFRGSTVQWICSGRVLSVATEGVEASAGTDVPTPSTLYFRAGSTFGAESVQAESAGGGALYIRRGHKGLSYLVYSEESGGGVGRDLSSLSSHLFSAPIVEMALQRSPETILWMVRADGILLSATIEFGAGVIAFAQHQMGGGGEVESIEIIRSGNEDQIWLSVKRGSSRTVEYMAPRSASALVDAHYVDCGLALTPGGSTVSGLSHLEGKVVTGLGDGAVLPERTVSSGQVSYDRTIESAHIGLPFSSVLEPAYLALPMDGFGLGKRKRIEEATLLLHESLGGAIGTEESNAESILYRDGKDWESPVPLYTGEKKKTVPAKVSTRGEIHVRQDSPYPFCLNALALRVGILEG